MSLSRIKFVLFAIVLCVAGAVHAQDRLRVLGISIEGNETTDVGLISAH